MVGLTFEHGPWGQKNLTVTGLHQFHNVRPSVNLTLCVGKTIFPNAPTGVTKHAIQHMPSCLYVFRELVNNS